MKTFSIKELIKFGWHKTKENVAEVVTTILFIILLSLANNFFHDRMEFFDASYHMMLLFFTQLALGIIGIVFSMNLIKEGLVVVRGGKGNVKNFLKYPDNFWSYVGGLILSGIITVVGFIIFIIPGILASLALFFVKPVLVDMKIGPVAGLKKSWNMAKGHWWELFLFSLVIILFNIGGLLILGIGLLFTAPISFFAFLKLYDIFLNSSSQQSH